MLAPSRPPGMARDVVLDMALGVAQDLELELELDVVLGPGSGAEPEPVLVLDEEQVLEMDKGLDEGLDKVLEDAPERMAELVAVCLEQDKPVLEHQIWPVLATGKLLAGQ